MFGNKQEKQGRLARIAELVAHAPSGLSQADLSRVLGVTRGTINKDLAALEEKGIRLAEDDHGRLFQPDWE